MEAGNKKSRKDQILQALARMLETSPGERITTAALAKDCLLYTSPSPRDGLLSRMPSSA